MLGPMGESGKAGHKVLILSASAGTGHLRAAAALLGVCKGHRGIGEVRNVDALTYTNKLFRDFYSKLYIQLIVKSPTFLGWWYDQLDEPWHTAKMRLMMDRINTRPLVQMIKEFNPDITICTHFLPAEIISHLITEKRLKTRLSIVVTDFDVHAMWLCKSFHHYFVALDESKAHLTAMGLPEQRISVSGIPIGAEFSARRNRDALRMARGLSPDRPVILLSAGALSVGPAEYIVRALARMKTPAQVVVICGKNETLKAEVEAEVRRHTASPVTYTVTGYTDVMHEWMALADLFLGKPGGLTTAESLASGLPMLIFQPIPGQEERNSDHLLEQGVAIRCNQITTMAYKIDRLFQDPKRLRSMAAAAKRMAKPRAAREIVETLLAQFNVAPVQVPAHKQKMMTDATRIV